MTTATTPPADGSATAPTPTTTAAPTTPPTTPTTTAAPTTTDTTPAGSDEVAELKRKLDAVLAKNEELLSETKAAKKKRTKALEEQGQYAELYDAEKARAAELEQALAAAKKLKTKAEKFDAILAATEAKVTATLATLDEGDPIRDVVTLIPDPLARATALDKLLAAKTKADAPATPPGTATPSHSGDDNLAAIQARAQELRGQSSSTGDPFAAMFGRKKG